MNTLPPLRAGSPVARAMYALFTGAANVQLADDPDSDSLRQLCEVAYRMVTLSRYQITITIPYQRPGAVEAGNILGAALNAAAAFRSIPGLRCEASLLWQGVELKLLEPAPAAPGSLHRASVMVELMDDWDGFDADIAIIHPDFAERVPAGHRFSGRHFLWAPGMELPAGADTSLDVLTPEIIWGCQIPAEVVLAGAPS